MITSLSEPRLARTGSKPPPIPSGLRLPLVPKTAPLVLGNRNSSFLLRRDDQMADGGVQLPLLAPRLAGLRLRTGAAGPEFILPNPSGGRGVYVTSWPVVTGFATPSLHDTLLIGRLSGHKRVDPQMVRDAARWVAREGYAGTAAAEAAMDVDQSLRTAALRLSGQLLMALARRAGFTKPEDAARCLNRGGFYQLAGRLGWHGPELAEALRSVSGQYATVAINHGPDCIASSGHWDGSFAAPAGSGRWGRLVSLMQRFRTALAQEQSGGHGADGATIGRIIAAADQCLTLADRLLPKIEAMQFDPMPLLEAWRDGHASTSLWLGELETAFDGWGRICLLWFDTDTPLRRQEVVAEIAILTRTVGNAETRLLVDGPGDPAIQTRLLLERNERLRARELLLDVGGA